MREYEMRRGETLDERAPDLVAVIERYFGPVTGTEEYEGHELHVVEAPDNPAFERIVAGPMRFSGRKDRLAVHFEERDPAELVASGDIEVAAEAVQAKNDFLEEVTGRDAKSRRESMKRAVEDAPDDANL
ncbi:MAG: DUF5611 family protein [Halobacteriota archaeon]